MIVVPQLSGGWQHNYSMPESSLSNHGCLWMEEGLNPVLNTRQTPAKFTKFEQGWPAPTAQRQDTQLIIPRPRQGILRGEVSLVSQYR
jgi:hypothetical protein